MRSKCKAGAKASAHLSKQSANKVQIKYMKCVKHVQQAAQKCANKCKQVQTSANKYKAFAKKL